MVPRRCGIVEGTLQDRHDLLGAGVRGGPAGRQIPHLPGRLGHDRLGEHRTDLEIIGVGREDLAHLAGEGLVPGRHVLDRQGLGRAILQGAEHRLLDRARLFGMRERSLHGAMRRRQLPAVRVAEMPGQVVVRRQGVALPPLRHRGGRIMSERLLEALDRLAVIEAEEPVEAAIEPELRVR